MKFNKFILTLFLVLSCWYSASSQCNIAVTIVDQVQGPYHYKQAVVTDSLNNLYYYQWNAGGPGYDTVNAWRSNYHYCVTVTDGNNCTASFCDSSCSIGGYAYDTVVTGGAQWRLFAVPTTGSAPYTYQWSNGNTVASFLTTVDNAYYVTVTDAHGCTGIFSDTTGNTGCRMVPAFTYTNVGSVYTFNATQTGGVQPILYGWTIDNGYVNLNPNTSYGATLAPGSHTICVQAQDHAGCFDSVCSTIYVGCALSGYITAQNGGGYAILTAHTSSAHGPLTYHWSPGSSNSNILTVANTANYCVTVTDSVGCSTTFCYYWSPCNMYAAITYSHSPTNIYTLNAVQTGGTAPYHCDWTFDGYAVPSHVATLVDSLPPGAHLLCVTITDTIGCSATSCDTIIVTAPATCSISVSMVDTIIGGGNPAKLAIVSDPLNTSYTYHWNTNSIYDTTSVWYAYGHYCVTVTDGNNCTASVCDTSCTLYAYAYETVSGLGWVEHAVPYQGTAPYRYHWSNGDTTAIFNTAAQGIYYVTITDANGCTGVAHDTLGSVCYFSGNITAQNQGTLAILYANVYNHHGPVTYQWSNGASTSNILTVVNSGLYCVTATDSIGCSVVLCDSISLGCTLQAYISDSNFGTYHILGGLAASGTPAYTYMWSNGANTQNIFVQQTGTYCLTVSDANGCTASTCDTVQFNCNVHAVFTYSNVGSVYSFYGAQTGGIGTTTYYWSIDNGWTNGSTSNTYTATLTPGPHTVCVIAVDANQCSDSTCQQITVVAPPCNLAGYITTQNFGTYAILTAHSSGAYAYPNYHWANSFSNVLTVTQSNVYCVTITDSLGCSVVVCDTVSLTGTCSAAFTYSDSCGVMIFVPSAYTPGSTLTWHFGDGTTSAAVVALHHYATQGTYYVNLTIHTPSGCTDSVTTLITAANISCSHDTICGSVFGDLNGNGVEDGTELGIPNQTIYIYQGLIQVAAVNTDASGHYSAGVSPGTYTIYYTTASGEALTIPVGSSSAYGAGEYDLISISGGGHHCGYNFGLADSNITISGYVYLDANGNGIKDAGETGIANEVVHVGPHWVYTDNTGFYLYVGPTGPYSITYIPSSPYSAYTATPTSHFVNATTVGNLYTGNNFGLTIATTTCNIATTIIPITTVTAGYPSWYDIYVSNYGTNVASGTMTFFYDPALVFSSAYPAWATLNTTGHYITFNYTGLQPGQYAYFSVTFNASANVVVGQSTFEMATATDNCNESNYHDNTDTLHQTATGSWDPNVKIVTPSGVGSQGLITRDQELRYTINFQNTGTAPAVNIVLKDSIPLSLDMSTFHVIGASHPAYAVQVDGNNLICRFSQIMLPDSATDERGSHGYLSFAAKPLSTIADGAHIMNRAAIYFDYNAAVQTNQTYNTIDYSLSVADLDNHATITVMPNPFSEHTTIRVTGADMHDAVLEVYNALGQMVNTTAPAADGVFTLSRGSLSSGIYTYHIRQSGRSVGSGKLVIE